MRIVPPADVERLAERLGEMLDDPALTADLGNHARATVEREFSWQACGKATVAAYEKALAR
jgi:glycosyltransferase involved in cell wall biosynthesis